MGGDKKMSEMIDEFSDLTLIHNKTDIHRHRRFTEMINGIYETVNQELEEEALKKDLAKWDKAEIRSANCNLDLMPGGKKSKEAIRKGVSSFFITGAPSSGKTALSKCIAREMIRMKIVKPSQIKILSESEILLLNKRGYIGSSEQASLLSGDYKLYIIDDAGGKDYYNYDREILQLELIFNHAYDYSKHLIIVSNLSMEEFLKPYSNSVKNKIREKCFESLTSKPSKRGLKENGNSLPEDVLAHFD